MDAEANRTTCGEGLSCQGPNFTESQTRRRVSLWAPGTVALVMADTDRDWRSESQEEFLSWLEEG